MSEWVENEQDKPLRDDKEEPTVWMERDDLADELTMLSTDAERGSGAPAARESAGKKIVFQFDASRQSYSHSHNRVY